MNERERDRARVEYVIALKAIWNLIQIQSNQKLFDSFINNRPQMQSTRHISDESLFLS